MKKYNITKRIFTLLLTAMFAFSLFIITVSADIIWYTDEYILVGNENYTVNQTMNFSYREHTSVYLLLNHTYYNLSSPNDINITLTYLHENISNTTYDDLVLGFYANTSSGNIYFNLSDFTSGLSYTVYKNGNLYDSVTANSTGVISFSNSDWSPENPLFEVYNNNSGDVTWHSESFGGSVTVGISIIITNDGEFDSDHYVFRGAGTANDPYIIENLTASNISITGPDVGSPITKHFKIQNVTIINELKVEYTSDNVAHIYDVHVGNVTNKSISFYYSNGVTVENCTFINHTNCNPLSYGVVALIKHNANSSIVNCTFVGNDTADPPGDTKVRGLSFGYIGNDNITVDNCNFTEQCVGIRSLTPNVTYRNCYFYNNTDEGIYSRYCQFLIENCEFTGTNQYDMGIEVFIGYTTKTDAIIRNCTFDACYDGIKFMGDSTYQGNISDSTIFNCTFVNLSNRAISFRQVDNVTVSNCTINNTHTGILLNYEGNSDVGVRDCTFSNTTITNTTYGVTFSHDKQINDNLFYNNYFADNTEHVHEYPAYPTSADNQTWNTTKTLGTNIIDGPYLGGNYWDNYTGYDTNDDGIGDTDVPFMGLDNLPLSERKGTTWYSSSFGGSVIVSSGEEVTNWHSSSFGGSVSVTEQGVSWHSSSFGGSVTIGGYGNWSEYWRIGQTVIYDCTDPLDLKVNQSDIDAVLLVFGSSGGNGWIVTDINDDGEINYLDISGVALEYGWDESGD